MRCTERAKRGVAAALVTAAALLLSPAHAQQRVTLNFVNTEIEAVARAMSDFTGRIFVVDPRVKGTVTLVVDRPVGAGEAIGALASALRVQNIALVDAGGVIRIVPEADAKLQGGPVRTEPGPARGDEMVTQVFRLNYESAVAIAQVLRPLIASNNPINAYAANNTIVVTDYAENVRRIGRIIAAIDTPAGSDVDVVPLQHAIATDVATVLGRLLETPGGAPADASQRVSILAEPSSNTLLIRAPTAARANLVRTLAAKLDQPSVTPGNIHVVYLKNANAVTLARTLLGVAQPEAPPTQPPGTPPPPGSQAPRTPGLAAQAALKPLPGTTPGAAVTGQVGGAQIQADPATNTLIIIAPDVVYRNLRAVIDQLDIRRAQVFIESLIVEVTSDQAAEFGIQWQGGLGNLEAGASTGIAGGTNFGTTGQNILSIAQNPATAGTGLNIGIAKGQITLPGVGVITNLQFLARALEATNKANILSTPNLLTLDNEEARIVVGQNVPFVTGQFTTSASAAVNPFQTIERRDVGLTLRVRPQISEAGTIKLVIYQEVSSVVEPISPAGIITNMRSIETNVLVDHGSIVVLGGLVQDNVSNTVEKVPVLGDIPILGHLFRYETRRQQKTNLMVFLRPIIVRDDNDIRGVTLDRYERMRRPEDVAPPKPHPVLPDLQPPVLPPP
ncbi:MAG TPA: type II secretion system secretin GspD [Burkholderiales bacterium]